MARSQESKVHPDLLQPNPWNTNVVSPENEAKIEESMKRLGVFRPITVRELPAAGGAPKFEILAGEHRWQIAKRLGYTEIPVFNVGVIDDKKAKEISLADNARYGEDDALQLSSLLKELGSVEELASFLPYQDAELAVLTSQDSIALDELGMTPTEPNAVDTPKPAPTHQVMRFKVPVQDAAMLATYIEQIMRENNYTTDDSMINAGNALVTIITQHKSAREGVKA